MKIEIKIPSVGESVTEALLAEWFKKDGDAVRKDEALFVLETDKVTLEVTAEAAGRLHIQVAAGPRSRSAPLWASISAADAAEMERPPAEKEPLQQKAPLPKPAVVEKPPSPAAAPAGPAAARAVMEGLPPSCGGWWANTAWM